MALPHPDAMHDQMQTPQAANGSIEIRLQPIDVRCATILG